MEKICKNREFSSENREIRSKDHRVRFSVHTGTTKDKEHAMTETLKSSIAFVGIDIGRIRSTSLVSMNCPML